jgi:Tfp pilus assembly protein PilO
MNRNLLGYILFLVTVAFGFGVVMPKFQEVRGQAIDSYAYRNVADAKVERVKDYQELKSSFASQKDRISRVVSALPSKPEVPEMLVSVEAMARGSNVDLESLLPQSGANDQKINLTLIGRGELKSLESFWQSIIENDRPMSFTTLSLTGIQGSNDLAMSVSLMLPFAPKPQTTTTTTTTEGAQ